MDRELLSVGDRQGPTLRARGGHGRLGRPWLCHRGNGHKLNRRVRAVHDDHCLIGKLPKVARQSERRLLCQGPTGACGDLRCLAECGR
jgi:hypothetical protein